MSHALLRGTATKYNMGGAIVICGPLDAGRFRQGLECALGAHDVQRVRLHRDAETAMQEFLPEDECSYPFEMLDFANRPEPLQSAADWYSQTSASPYAWTSFRFTAKYCSGHSLIAATVAETYNELLRCRRHFHPPCDHREIDKKCDLGAMTGDRVRCECGTTFNHYEAIEIERGNSAR